MDLNRLLSFIGENATCYLTGVKLYLPLSLLNNGTNEMVSLAVWLIPSIADALVVGICGLSLL